MQADTKAWRAEVQLRRKQKQAEDVGKDGGDEAADTWKDHLIARLLAISADGFERLSQRLLREAGFVNVTVLGKSGDGGIDGVGVYRLSLVSFPVYFQCKRYKGDRHRWSCSRLSGSDGRSWREGTPHHHGVLHEGRSERGEP